METLNMSYIKRFVTKFAKDTGAKIVIDSMTNSLVKIVYEKDSVFINIIIRARMKTKYEVGIQCNICNITFSTNNLNEVVQACDLLIQPVIRYDQVMEMKAVIKSNHWGVKLVTVERQDGYRANLYISDALMILSKMNCIRLQGIHLTYDSKTGKTKAVYDKYVLNYDKIQKDGSWSNYDTGFKPVVQYPNGEDYIHPSLKWQKGRLF